MRTSSPALWNCSTDLEVTSARAWMARCWTSCNDAHRMLSQDLLSHTPFKLPSCTSLTQERKCWRKRLKVRGTERDLKWHRTTTATTKQKRTEPMTNYGKGLELVFILFSFLGGLLVELNRNFWQVHEGKNPETRMTASVLKQDPNT